MPIRTNTEGIPMSLIDDMLLLATTRHAGQVDPLTGEPKILHVIRVGMAMEHLGPEAQVVGFGHDLIEKTETTKEELYELGFHLAIIGSIVSVTRQLGETDQQLSQRAAQDNFYGLHARLEDAHDKVRRLRLELLTAEQVQAELTRHQATIDFLKSVGV